MKVPRTVQKKSKRNPKDYASTTSPQTGEQVYYFGSFCVNQTERLLLRNGEPIRLTPKVFDVLLLLIQNRGSLVTKERLLNEIWPDAFVEEANLSVNIASLRKALDEGFGERQYIETVPKRGYRFVAPVSEARDEVMSTVNTRLLRETFVFGEENGGERDQVLNSVAVLPFENESSGSDAVYLAAGLTESIINSLSQLRDLRVMARNTVYSYQGKDMNPRTVGQELGVRSVLIGRILELGDRLIIRAELVDVLNGWQLWGAQYHRTLSDVLVVQEEIAEEISEKLRLKLTVDEKRQLTKRHTGNSEAYHLYLKGRYHWNKYAQKGLGKAIQYFSQAIEEDPTYALAYAGLADSYYRLSSTYLPTRETMPKAKLAALKAIEIDEKLAEAHAALGLVLMSYDWDWMAAEREFLRAIELNPGSAIAHQRLALYLNFLGRFDEAMHQLQLAIELDPLSPQISQGRAFLFLLKGEHEQAIEQVEKTLAMSSSYHPAYYILGWVYKRKGDLPKAIESFERLTELDDSPVFLAALAHVCGLNGDHDRALGILDELEEQSERRYLSSYCRAVVYMGLDERDQAFYWLEKAFGERSEMLAGLKVGCEFDSLRADARFSELLKRVGLHA